MVAVASRYTPTMSYENKFCTIDQRWRLKSEYRNSDDQWPVSEELEGFVDGEM